jgi:hypothetical protein
MNENGQEYSFGPRDTVPRKPEARAATVAICRMLLRLIMVGLDQPCQSTAPVSECAGEMNPGLLAGRPLART